MSNTAQIFTKSEQYAALRIPQIETLHMNEETKEILHDAIMAAYQAGAMGQSEGLSVEDAIARMADTDDDQTTSDAIDTDATLEAIPDHFVVKVIDTRHEDPADLVGVKDLVTDGTCGLSWDDAISTSLTPAPSGRCPFEYFHTTRS